MTRTTRLPTLLAALIALSMLTTGLAVVSGSTASTEEVSDERPGEDREERPAPRNLRLTGNLTHDETGDRLPGIELTVENHYIDRRTDPAQRGFERYTVNADANGSYAVNVSYGRVEVSIDAPDHQGVHASFEVQDNVTLDIPLRPVDGNLSRITGQVTDTDDDPIEDARVNVRATDDSRCGPDYCHAEDSTREDREDREHVVHVDDETVVIRYEPRDDRHAWTRTDASGNYAVRVPAGTYQVRAHAQDHLDDGTEVDAPANGTAEADLALTPIPPDSVTVTGVVRDDGTGEPIPYAEVTVRNDVWGAYNHSRADEDGRYEVGTKPGHAIVTARADERYWVPCEDERAEPVHDGDGGGDAPGKPRPACDGSRERDRAYLPRVSTHQPNAGETIQLDPSLEREPEPDATFSGWVVNASSEEGVPNATVTFRNEETNDWGRAETDANGSFAIDVRAGYYSIHVRAPGHLSFATNERIETGGDERLTLEVQPGESRRGGCCVVYHERSASGTAVEDGGAGGDDGDASRDVAYESEGNSASSHEAPDGRQAFEGSSGGLGPYPGAETSTNGDGGVQATPMPSVVGTVALAALGAAALKLYRPRRQ